jgi:hypothetical protein
MMTLPRQIPLTAKNDDLNNYKPDGEYFNGISFVSAKVLIDTGANGNYISHKFCLNL